MIKQITWDAVVGRILRWPPKFLTPSPIYATCVTPRTVKMIDFTPVMICYMAQLTIQRVIIQVVLTHHRSLLKVKNFLSWSQKKLEMPKQRHWIFQIHIFFPFYHGYLMFSSDIEIP